MKKFKTTFWDFLFLVLRKELSVKQVIDIIKNPIEIFINEGKRNEYLLTSFYGLKIITKIYCIDENGNLYKY